MVGVNSALLHRSINSKSPVPIAAEDQQLVPELHTGILGLWSLMEGNLAQTTPAHNVLETSPTVQKDPLVDKLQVCRVEATGFEEVASMQRAHPDRRSPSFADLHPTAAATSTHRFTRTQS